MPKLLIFLVCCANLLITGCGTEGNSFFRKLAENPFVYTPDIQQGNVVSQETVDQLQPGMAKRQVLYIMGSPMLVDSFHQERWDYIYTLKRKGEPLQQERLTLFFTDNKLARIEGDFHPQPSADPLATTRESVVTVPDYEEPNKGLFSQALEVIGIGGD